MRGLMEIVTPARVGELGDPAVFPAGARERYSRKVPRKVPPTYYTTEMRTQLPALADFRAPLLRTNLFDWSERLSGTT